MVKVGAKSSVKLHPEEKSIHDLTCRVVNNPKGGDNTSEMSLRIEVRSFSRNNCRLLLNNRMMIVAEAVFTFHRSIRHPINKNNDEDFNDP